MLEDIEGLLIQNNLITLNSDELLLLDFILSYPMPSVSVELNWHMEWYDFRLQIWQKIHEFKNQELICIEEHKAKPQNPVASIDIDLTDARVLMSLVPTTFRWGPGEDCGYSLKLKLYRYITGEEEYHAPDKNTSESKAPATDKTEDGPLAYA